MGRLQEQGIGYWDVAYLGPELHLFTRASTTDRVLSLDGRSLGWLWTGSGVQIVLDGIGSFLKRVGKVLHS